MVTVFFVYGLAFFLLGFAVLLYPKKGSAFELGQTVWLVGAFGLLHGANEWLDMFRLVHGSTGPSPLRSIAFVALPVSYVPLLVFGLSGRTRSGWIWRLRWAIPILLLLLWGTIVLVSAEPHVMARIWGRYLMATTGTALAAWRLLEASSAFGEVAAVTRVAVRPPLRSAAVAFGGYGMVSGLVGPPAPFFPASVLNETVFLQSVGVPIQLFRAVGAVILLACFVSILRVFAIETQELLRRAKADLEVRVRERTAELESALLEVKTLRGLLPICAWCRKIRDDNDQWMEVEAYIRGHTDALVTHSICPACRTKLL